MDHHRLGAATAVAFVLALSQPSPAAESGKATNTRSGESFAALSGAILAAQPGDRIELGSGRYEGSFEIGTAIALVGVDTGGGAPVVDGMGATVVFDVTAANTSIEGLGITSTGAPARPWGFLTPYAEEACVLVEADDVRIALNTITGCGQGIYVRNTRDAQVYHNTVAANHIGGIFLLNSQAAKIEANTLEDNGYQGITVQTFSFPPGIELSYRVAKLVGEWWQVTPESRDMADIVSEDILISGNVVTGHGSGGVVVGFARRVSVLANTTDDNGGAPPSEIDAAYYGSIVTSAEGRGFGIALFCDAYDNVVADNLVRRNDDHGIDVSSAVNNHIARNVVEDSAWGIMIRASFGNLIEDNVVTGNTEYGLRIEAGQMVGSPPLPSIANTILRNDLFNPGVNAFDNSHGNLTQPGASWLEVMRIKRLPRFPTDYMNHWDDGLRGNHYGDFDVPSEGFADGDGDGIGEVGHAIAGGRAVDHFPLASAVPTLTGDLPATNELADAGDGPCGGVPARCDIGEAAPSPCPAG